MQPTHRSSRILLPARQSFVVLTLLLALMLNFLPWTGVPMMPDWVALVLAFWCVREPLRVGTVSAFLLGVLMDVAYGSLMGQHALAYVLLAYWAAALSRRILWFPLWQQALHVFPLFLLSQVLMVLVRLAAGDDFPGWPYFLASPVATLLWYPLTFLLLLPQFRPLEKDDNRPI